MQNFLKFHPNEESSGILSILAAIFAKAPQKRIFSRLRLFLRIDTGEVFGKFSLQNPFVLRVTGGLAAAFLHLSKARDSRGRAMRRSTGRGDTGR